MVAAKRFPTLDDLRSQLAIAEVEFECALYIDSTDRSMRERQRWSVEVERLRAEIEACGEAWSGVWK
jgi:hypothetical protein